MTKFEAVQIPKAQLLYFLKIKDHPYIRRKYYFTSKSEFVRRAISEYVDKLEKDILRIREIEEDL